MVCSKLLLGGKIMFVTYLTYSCVSVLLKNCRLSVVLLHCHPFESAASSCHHHLMVFLLLFCISEIPKKNYIRSDKNLALLDTLSDSLARSKHTVDILPPSSCLKAFPCEWLFLPPCVGWLFSFLWLTCLTSNPLVTASSSVWARSKQCPFIFLGLKDRWHRHYLLGCHC